jgi:hypothetical protein
VITDVGDALALVRALIALHQAEDREVTEYVGVRGRAVTVKVCGHCASLCHSRSGLGCDDPTDALYPCDTIKLLQEYV